MVSSKFKIKPVHLVFIGLVIIILGILIPSFFINAFSTIGFAVIIGTLILLSAYAFFAVNTVKSKGKKTIKWLILPVILGVLVAGGFIANNKYNEYLANKIYAVGDTVNLSGFTFRVTNSSFAKVDLKMPDKKVKLYGDKFTMEDCKQYPFLNIAPSFWDDNYNPDVSEDDYEIAHPSKKYCDWRNESRTKVKKYEDNHDKLSLNYEINATENIDAKNIGISIVLDSGRNPDTKAFEYDALLSTKYVPPLDYTYHTQHIDKADGTINKGIVRKGSVNVDVAEAESTIDLVVKYDGQTRIIRISR